MRTRPLKPSFFKNEDLAECSPWARLLLQGLWAIADAAGRLEYRPKKIRAEIFPHDDPAEVDIDSRLCELLSRNFVFPYEVDGRKFLKIPNFKKHARPHPDEKIDESIPEPEKTTASHGISRQHTNEQFSAAAKCPSLPFASFPIPCLPSPSLPESGDGPPSASASPLEDPERVCGELVKLYTEVVTAKWGPRGHASFRRLIRDEGVPRADVEAAIRNFGAFHDRDGTPHDKRPKAATLLDSDDWRAFVAGVPPPTMKSGQPQKQTRADRIEEAKQRALKGKPP